MRIGPRIGIALGEHLGIDVPDPQTTLTVNADDPIAIDPITGVNFSGVFAVTNTGSIDAWNVVATITLDSSYTFVSASGTGWACSHSGGVVTCTRATLAPGEADITVTIRTGASAGSETMTINASAGNAPAATPAVLTTNVRLVTTDATSGKRAPTRSQEWLDFINYHIDSGTPNFPTLTQQPSFLWLLQEASGNPADTGGNSADLTATGLEYQVPVTGWTRTAIQTTDNTADAAISVSAALPDLLTTSALLLVYVAINATPGGTRGLAAMGGLGATAAKAHVNTTPAIVGIDGANSATGATAITAGAVFPLVIQHDTSTPAARVFTETDEIVPAFSALVTGKTTSLGTTTSTAAGARYLYACQWVDTDGEITTANVKALLTALGWSPTWTP